MLQDGTIKKLVLQKHFNKEPQEFDLILPTGVWDLQAVIPDVMTASTTYEIITGLEVSFFYKILFYPQIH